MKVQDCIESLCLISSVSQEMSLKNRSKKLSMKYVLKLKTCPDNRPRRLTFTWWGCCSLCLRHKPTELALSFLFCSCVSVSVFVALSTVFHSMNSPDNSPLSHFVLPVLFLPY